VRIRPFLFVVAAGALASACADDPLGPPPQDAAPPPPRQALDRAAIQHPFADRHTPFQRSLLQRIADRRAAGLAVPESLTFTFDDVPAAPHALRRLDGVDGKVGGGVTATTTVVFASAAQAGAPRWPALVVRGTMPDGATGFIHEGDYTPAVRQQILEQYPNANVDFDTGQRTYTITETILDRTPPQAQSLLGLDHREVLDLTTSGGMLMGFTIPGPAIDYHVEYNLDVCIIWFFGCVVEWDVVDFWAGFVLDWTIITRLPMDVSLTSVDPVLEGSTFTPVTAATGRDWSAADYTQAGLAAENGDEFVLRFQFGLGVFLTVSYIPVVDWGIPPIDIDRRASFTTPLGAGQMFSLPGINLSLWNIDVALAEADFGVVLTPLLGSDRYTADWSASGAGSGSGGVTYTTAGTPVALGAIHADDGPGDAAVALNNFRYHFTQFGLDIGLYFYLWVAGWDHTWTIPVTQFDLGGLMGGLYVGSHAGTPGGLNLLVPVTNVAPGGGISRSGAVRYGSRTFFLAEAGSPMSFIAGAADPGADDLTFTWRWNDGTPDDVTTYPVPHNVREVLTHQFPRPCLNEVVWSVADGDGGVRTDRVVAVLTGPAGNPAELVSFWLREYGAGGVRSLPKETLRCYLNIAGWMSDVFGEARDASTPALALDVLRMRPNGGEPREQLDRNLLIAWLNFANGGFGWTERVDTNNDREPDMTFTRMMAEAEALRRNPAATAAQLRQWTSRMNSAFAAAAN
jgi:hypothetical protein